MSDSANTVWEARLRMASRAAAWGAIFIGGSTLAGWITGHVGLQAWFVSPITMKVNTALAFVFTGAGLLLLHRAPAPDHWRRWTGRALSVLILLIAVLNVLQYALARDLGIDNLLFPEAFGPLSGAAPGRMALATAVAFLALSGALLCLDRCWPLRMGLGALAALIGVLGIESLLLDLKITITGMATHTILGFFVLGLGVLCARPEEGLTRWFTSAGPSGAMARRLLPCGIGVPVALTWLAHAGAQRGWYGPLMQLCLLAMGQVVVLCALILWALGSARRIEQARDAAEAKLKKANRALRALSAASQTVIHAGEESRLLADVCRALVEVAGYKTAWAGAPLDDPSKTILPVAFAGPGQEYLAGLRVSWAEMQQGHGAAGQAVRSGQPQYAADLQTDPEFAPWPEAASAHGFGSMVALPLPVGDGVPGVLCLYTAERDGFDGDEIRLLTEMSETLAFGLGALRERVLRREAETALRQSERRYRCLAEATTQIVWAVGPSGLVDPPVPGWQAFTGQSDDEVRGEGWVNAVHPEDAARTMAIWRLALQTGVLYDTEFRVRRHDGVYRLMAVRGVAVRNEDGIIHEWVGTCMDITEQREAESALREAEAYNRGLFEASSDGLAVVDENLRVTDLNEALCRLTGRPPAALLGSFFPDCFTEPEEARQGMFNTLRHGAAADVTLTLKAGEGRTIPVSLNASVFRDAAGLVRGVVAAARDITQRQRQEEALARFAEELKRSNQELEEFATVASHDLQEPLRKISAFGERLARHSAAALDDRSREYLDRMLNASRRMSELISSLLELSRVTRRGRPFEATNLDTLAREVLDDLEGRIEESRAQVTVEALPTVIADRTQMRQLLQNLISNALKFRKAEGGHRVHIAGRQRDSAGWEIHVSDNGIGFEERFLDRIFKPFQRLHGRGEYEGHGMGLAVCERIVRRHGGRLTAHSQPGQGSDFVVTLPQRPPAE